MTDIALPLTLCIAQAQRLGRILRAKGGATGPDEYNAYFYTVVRVQTRL